MSPATKSAKTTTTTTSRRLLEATPSASLPAGRPAPLSPVNSPPTPTSPTTTFTHAPRVWAASPTPSAVPARSRCPSSSSSNPPLLSQEVPTRGAHGSSLPWAPLIFRLVGSPADCVYRATAITPATPPRPIRVILIIELTTVCSIDLRSAETPACGSSGWRSTGLIPSLS